MGVCTGGHGPPGASSGAAYWMAQCPAHDDSNPSMQIKDRGDGTASIECFAGCDFVDILKAVGFYATGGSKTPETAPSAPPRPRQAPAKEPPKPQPLPTGKNVTAYYYTTADPDEIVFAVIRRDYDDKPKRFSQWMPTADGQWLPVAPTERKPMYQLPTIGAPGAVAIVEGEKCVHALKDAWPKRAVTTWAGGTNAWQLTDWTPLAGRERVSYWQTETNRGTRLCEALALHLCQPWDARSE